MSGAVARDPFWSSTSSLLHLDSNLTDSASATWTARLSAAISTAQQKFGAGSLSLSTQYIEQTGSSSLFDFSTNDFTIEMWIYPTSLSGLSIFYDGRPNGVQGANPTVYLNGNKLSYYANAGATTIGGTTNVTANTWSHVAACRASGVTRIFLNGTQEGSVTDSTTYSNTTNRPWVGVDSSAPNLNPFIGYVDEIRVTKAARYSTSFTAPTQPFLNS